MTTPTRNKSQAYITIGVLAGLMVLLYYFSSIFLPVLVALILAYLLNPLVSLLERRGTGRTTAILVVFVCLVVLLVAGAVMLVSSVSSEFQNVQINLPEYTNRLYELIPRQVKVHFGIETPEKVYERINQGMEALRGVSFDIYRESFAIVRKAFSSTLTLILVVAGYFITPLYLFYFLKDMPQLKNYLKELVPPRKRESLTVTVDEIDDVLSAFVRGQLSVCAILALLYSIGLLLIGIDLAVVIGVLSGVFFIIPYFGTVIGILLSVTMALLKFHDILHPLLCLGWFVFVQGLEGMVITPKIVGDKVGLHPVIVILALFIGGQLFGIFGMLLAMPVAAVIKVLFRSFLETYRSSAYYRGVD